MITEVPAVTTLLPITHPFAVLLGFGVAVALPVYLYSDQTARCGEPSGIAGRALLPRGRFRCRQSGLYVARSRFVKHTMLRAGSGLILLLGTWRRSRTAYNLAGGAFKPGGKLDRSAAPDNEVVIFANLEGGDLIVWKELHPGFSH